jgi:hypothetical protein
MTRHGKCGVVTEPLSGHNAPALVDANPDRTPIKDKLKQDQASSLKGRKAQAVKVKCDPPAEAAVELNVHKTSLAPAAATTAKPRVPATSPRRDGVKEYLKQRSAKKGGSMFLIGKASHSAACCSIIANDQKSGKLNIMVDPGAGIHKMSRTAADRLGLSVHRTDAGCVGAEGTPQSCTYFTSPAVIEYGSGDTVLRVSHCFMIMPSEAPTCEVSLGCIDLVDYGGYVDYQDCTYVLRPPDGAEIKLQMAFH